MKTRLVPLVLVMLASAFAGGESVQVEGVLRQVYSEGKKTLRLVLDGPDKSSVVRVQGDKDVWRKKIDSDVRCTGERKETFNPRGEVIGHYVEAEQRDVRIVGKGSSEDPFSAPEVPLDDIWNKAAKPGHLRCVTGIVTWSCPEMGFYLQKGENAVFVSTKSKDAVALGSVMKVTGFARMEHCVGVIQANDFRKIGEAPAPATSEVKCEELWEYSYRKDGERSWDAMPVTVKGRISRTDATGKRKNVFVAEAGDGTREDTRFMIVFRDEMPEELLLDFEDRPVVKVSGVCHLAFSPTSVDSNLPRISHVEVRVRSLDDFEVLPDVEFEGRVLRRKLRTALVWILGGVLLLLAFAIVKMIMDRMRVKHLEAIVNERKRMAVDLHDTIEQHLAGAALLLSTIGKSASKETPALRGALDNVAKILLQAKSEIRETVMNLRSDVIFNKKPEAVLLEQAAKLNASGVVRVRCKLRGLPESLPPAALSNLLCIVNEAVTNAIKHGKAQNIIFAADPSEEGFVLRIANDGARFDPQTVLGPAAGHFGLSGMRERARKNGFTMDICEEDDLMVVRLSCGKETYGNSSRDCR